MISKEQLDKYYHALEGFLAEAVKLGVSIQAAMAAFHEAFLGKHDPEPETFSSTGAVESLSPDAKVALAEAIANT